MAVPGLPLQFRAREQRCMKSYVRICAALSRCHSVNRRSKFSPIVDPATTSCCSVATMTLATVPPMSPLMSRRGAKFISCLQAVSIDMLTCAQQTQRWQKHYLLATVPLMSPLMSRQGVKFVNFAVYTVVEWEHAHLHPSILTFCLRHSMTSRIINDLGRNMHDASPNLIHNMT